jgi:hypothetical protein
VKATQLIAALQAAVAEVGDLEVFSVGDDYQYETGAVYVYAGALWIDRWGQPGPGVWKAPDA